MQPNREYWAAAYRFHADRLTALARADPDFWPATDAKMMSLCHEHGDDSFFIDLLCAVHSDLEARASPADRLQALRDLQRSISDLVAAAEAAANNSDT